MAHKRSISLVATCLALTACNKDSGGQPAGAQSAQAAESAHPAESIGVEACDRYFAKADECFRRKPEVRASLGDMVRQQRESWKASAATPEGRETLAAVCKSSLDGLDETCK